jgi:hypothetical protein
MCLTFAPSQKKSGFKSGTPAAEHSEGSLRRRRIAAMPEPNLFPAAARARSPPCPDPAVVAYLAFHRDPTSVGNTAAAPLLLPEYIDCEKYRWCRSFILNPVSGLFVLGPDFSRPILLDYVAAMLSNLSL